MSWDDDSDADEYGERRPARATGRQFASRVAGYAGLVAGAVALAVALVVGVIFAVNVVGLAANPGGFEAPAANGLNVALPPVTTQAEQSEQSGTEQAGQSAQDAQVDGQTKAIEEPTAESGPASPMLVVDSAWIVRIASATGIPERALTAYARSHFAIATEDPACGLDWATIAAIGAIESGHGSYGDSVLDENGNAWPSIIGRALDGDGVATIEDTDGGVLDGDVTWDRAVGPMQFIPSTWARWASDGNGDGVADPHQIDDAAQAAARYLCASGSMTSPEGWRAAVFSYNHDNDYVDKVARFALQFATSAG
ncbi:lytic transglycosylase domain-containing protein [Agromyces albus]|nr:lytic murein transglycosylase [Agromyces albus]